MIDDKYAERVINGMEPSKYDLTLYSFPTTVMTRIDYYLKKPGGSNLSQGYIEVTYTDPTKAEIAKIERF